MELPDDIQIYTSPHLMTDLSQFTVSYTNDDDGIHLIHAAPHEPVSSRNLKCAWSKEVGYQPSLAEIVESAEQHMRESHGE